MPAPGDRIGSFELEESIGVGGMGAVYRALDLRLERHVALKTLPPEQSHDSEVVQRFYQEARAAARLDHENIAGVYEIGHDKAWHYIAFEYIEGTTIRQRVQSQGALPVAEAINFTLQIAGALVHAVERGVVHRDIKPSNIIVTPQGRAKLVDMGLARRFERGGDDDGLTQSGMTLGTFDYISPEQARDPRDVDVRSDLYSLGCTLFYMLTARPPFPEGTVLQ
jgi:serine/threonine-protein kinase